MKHSMMKKFITYDLRFVTILFLIFLLTGCSQVKSSESQVSNSQEHIEYYTCGMHPSVNISVEEYNKGNKSCPICNMNLTPVYKEIEVKEVDKPEGAVGRIKIKSKEVALAGVRNEPVRKLHLFKEIRTVGRVAYDPELAIAQEEFLSAVKTLDKMQEGNILEIKERASNLVKSSKRRLKLLGLSEEQIKKLEEKKKVQTNLIMPEENMWIYGDVYEYELDWVTTGQKVKVTTSSFPGKEFYGVISSLNPVLDSKTRSVRFRANVDNPDLKLKPEMYVDVIIMSMYMAQDGEHEVLAIPKEAVLDTGMRKIAWVDKGLQEYEARLVEVGPEATAVIDGKEAKFYPVLKGLTEGEYVVTKANFLIDSQSQLSGVAASGYGGAMGAEEMKGSTGHQH